jgi:hypothetical protein
VHSDWITRCRRLVSTARASSSRMTRSPDLSVVAIRTPESKPALACRARLQFSARVFWYFSSSASFRATSACSACFFLSSSSLSLPAGFGAGAAGFADAALPGPAVAPAGAEATTWGGSARSDAGLAQDVLLGRVWRRRAVAVDLVAVLVHPLPLRDGCHRGQAQEPQNHCRLEFHAISLAPLARRVNQNVTRPGGPALPGGCQARGEG